MSNNIPQPNAKIEKQTSLGAGWADDQRARDGEQRSWEIETRRKRREGMATRSLHITRPPPIQNMVIDIIVFREKKK